MSKELLIPFALDATTGKVAHVDEVPNGNQSGCVCPVCDKPLIARNEGKVNAHHFAHASLSSSCGEAWLHKIAKQIVFERIESALESGKDIPLAYECMDCRCPKHTGNLLKGVDTVNLEFSIKDENTDIRPDIFLSGTKRKIVEIVDTHEPQKPVKNYAAENNIPLVELHVKEVADLDKLNSGELQSEYPLNVCPCKTKAMHREPTSCDWRWCDKCEGAVNGDHRHCASCGEAMEYSRGFPKHYCCHIADKFNLKPCSDMTDHGIDATHSHCKICGVRIKPEFDTCFHHKDQSSYRFKI